METTQKPEITFEDFSKVDLRLARIVKAENIEGADKLYKLTLDVGALGERVICAGIKQQFPDSAVLEGRASVLEGRSIVIVANLAPRKMRGIMSQGMLLAVANDDGSNMQLVTVPDWGPVPGSSVG